MLCNHNYSNQHICYRSNCCTVCSDSNHSRLLLLNVRRLLLTAMLIYYLCARLKLTLCSELEENEIYSETTSLNNAQANSTTVIQNYIKSIQSSTRQTTLPSPDSNQTTATLPSESRIYLEKGSINDGYLTAVKGSHTNLSNTKLNSYHNHKPQSRIQTSVQIYIVFFIGIMPATIGAFVWWIQNWKTNCFHPQGNNSNNNNTNANYDVEKLSQSLMKGDKASVDQLAYRLAKRAETLTNDQSSLIGNDFRSNFVKSRRVYSLEVPRKCLEMIDILGEGNFGQVWKARSQFGSKQMFVAVKTNKVNANLEQQEDLLKELDIMLQLGSHPNVVQLLGCCTENEPYYLVLEYISQGKLLSYLRHHRKDGGNHSLESKNELKTNEQTFINNNNYMTYCINNAYGYNDINGRTKSQDIITPDDLVQFAYQISKGMEFISSHGIIHRDLAARNILVDKYKNCKVADFGLSRSIRDKESDMYEMKHGGQMPIRWMSPETLSMGMFSTKSDVWAYGILIWEIVTLGSTPYVGMSAPEVINYIRQGNICPQPEHCSDDLYDLMKSCWAYKTEDRFTFADIKHYLTKMLITNNDNNEYIDLKHFNDSIYYFNTTGSPDEKL